MGWKRLFPRHPCLGIATPRTERLPGLVEQRALRVSPLAVTYVACAVLGLDHGAESRDFKKKKNLLNGGRGVVERVVVVGGLPTFEPAA